MKIFSTPRRMGDSKNSKNKQNDVPPSSPDITENVAADTPEESPAEIYEALRQEMPMAALAQKLGFSELSGKSVSDFFLHGSNPNDDESDFWDILVEKANILLREIEAAEDRLSDAEENALETENEGEEKVPATENDGEEKVPATENGIEVQPFSCDMHLEVFVSRDQLKAFGFIFPPIGSGQSLSLEQIKTAVAKEGVVFGINDELLEKTFNDKLFFKVFPLAEGKHVCNGADGQIIELYARDKQINLSVRDDETVNFKNLNWLQIVQRGDVICNIIPPVPAEDGMNVRGVVIKAIEGKMPKLPIGKNVVENEDHTALVAAVDGQLSFSGGIFKVEQLLQIDGDIDNSVGNLDVIGSVTVKGNVLEGFSIKATGDIRVSGSVAGATLTAGGNIHIIGGMNGNFKGKLDAGGTVSSKYLENCYVSSSGTVKAESIINSTVISSDKVIASTGRGAIIGSTITSFKGVEAKVIGNERNLPTKMTVGSDPRLSEEMRILKKEVEELTRKSDEYEKNIQFLMKAEKLDDVHQQLLNKLKLDYSIMKMNLSKKTNRIQVLENELQGDACHIIASQIFPPLIVTIGTVTQQFLTESRMSRIYKSEGEIVMGSK